MIKSAPYYRNAHMKGVSELTNAGIDSIHFFKGSK
jgi:hypothetical protein